MAVMNDEMFEVCFGTSSRSISRLPHCVARCDCERGPLFLKAVMDTTGATGAGWGQTRVQCLTDAGEYFLGTEIDDAKLFRQIWRFAPNQQQLQQHGAYPTDQFSMVIDINTDAAILKRLADSCRRHDVFDFCREDCLRLVVDCIEDIGWAYIPLTDEWYYAMFMARPRNADWINSVAERISKSGELVYCVECDDASCRLGPLRRWTG